MRKSWIAFALIGFFSGCEQNPFPKTGRILPDRPRVVVPPPVADIEMQPVLECVETEQCSTFIRGFFGEGGTPLLEFRTQVFGKGNLDTPLPDGASYDPVTGILAYTPGIETVGGYGTGSGSSGSVQALVIEALLRKQEEPRSVYKRKALLVFVKNKQRPVDLLVESGELIVAEGETWRRKVTVMSEDFPSGPFELAAASAPQGFTIEAKGPNEFELSYSPGHGAVTYQDTWDPALSAHKKVFNFELKALAPDGQVVSAPLSLTVTDSRLAPVVSAPATVTQWPFAVFTIRVDDFNGERAPAVQLPRTMPFGRLSVTEIPVGQQGFPSRLFEIRWDQIPETELGATVTFAFLVCGATSATEETFCRPHRTEVRLQTLLQEPAADKSGLAAGGV